MKRKCLAVGIILIFIGVSIIPSTAQNREKPSSPTPRGSWLYVGGSGPGNYTRIQDAIDNASTGDTVFVYNGTYCENLVVDKTINLIGEDRNTTIIDGGGNGNVVFIVANRTTLRKFTIRNSKEGIENAGIFIRRSNENIVSENIICNNDGNGILSLFSRENTYSRNKVTYNKYYGLNIRESDRSTILNNTVIENGEAGIVAVYSNDTVVGNNTVSITTYEGIGLWLCNGALIFNNTVTKTDFAAIFLYFSEKIFLTNNELRDNYQYGLYLDNSSNNTIRGNIICENNLSGVEINHLSRGNLIYYNNLVNNSINAHDEGDNTWNGEYPSGGNYWSDYVGSDTLYGPNQDVLGPDGVGDTPYHILGGSNQDHYPLMLPYGMTQLAFTLSHGGFGLSGSITNVGNTTAFRVCFRVTADGGFVLLGRNSLQVIPKPLLPGEKASVKSNFILGFGKILLTTALWADNAPYMSRTVSATLLLFFIIVLHKFVFTVEVIG